MKAKVLGNGSVCLVGVHAYICRYMHGLSTYVVEYGMEMREGGKADRGKSESDRGKETWIWIGHVCSALLAGE
jgi:hypothetical protein